MKVTITASGSISAIVPKVKKLADRMLFTTSIVTPVVSRDGWLLGLTVEFEPGLATPDDLVRFEKKAIKDGFATMVFLDASKRKGNVALRLDLLDENGEPTLKVK